MQQYTLDPKALLGGIIVEDNDQQIVQLALQKDNEIPPYQTDASKPTACKWCAWRPMKPSCTSATASAMTG